MKWMGRRRSTVLDPHQVPLFEILNGYSHKRGAVNVGNPAIIWHRAYWRPATMPAGKWHALVNSYIGRTLDGLRAQGRANLAASSGGRPEAAAADDPQAPPKRRDLAAFFIGFEIEAARITIVFEKFDEFWSIKTIADFSHVSADRPLPPGCYREMYDALATCERVIVDDVNAAQPGAPPNPEARHRQDLIVQQQSRRVSVALFEMISDLFPRLPREDRHREVIPISEMFAHFVGFSLGLDNRKPAARLTSTLDARLVDRVAPGLSFSENPQELGNLVDAIWPVAKWLNPMVSFGPHGSFCEPEPLPEDDRLKREFTISRLNRGRALYVTSLGGIEAPAQRNVYFPLSYLLVCPHKASWQIGRIVDRLHMLGLFRLAILRDYNLVERSNTKIGKLIRELSEKSETLERVSEEFDEVCGEVPKGLHYRIEWSHYYMSLYREAMSMLNFEKVEGYQTYAEFVSRKFSGRFKTIENVGRRFDYLSLKIRDRFNQATGSNIENLLAFAEIAGLIPITYYSMHVGEFVAEILHAPPLTLAGAHLTSGQWCGLTILALYLLLLLRWSVARRRKARTKQRRRAAEAAPD